MHKYLKILNISFQQEFAYRLNFIMWRIRNVMQILIFYFLWNSVFQNPGNAYFGYTKEKIISYGFILIFVRAIILSSRSLDVAGIISNGELSNYLLKPVSFFKYWLTRDISSKLLNIIFSLLEISILFAILRPNIYIQTYLLHLLPFILSLVIAGLIFFCITLLTSFVPFWVPELGWGAQFLIVIILVEFLSGASFPLDVFPDIVQNILKFTPFPYLIFIPIKMYLGMQNTNAIISSLSIGMVWVLILMYFVKKIWLKGLKIYEGIGR